MSETAIRAAIYNTVSGVTDIGKVYDYERWSGDWATFISLFKTTIAGRDQIRGWEIRRPGFDKKIMTLGGSENATRHDFQLNGYLGVDDAHASEKTMSALVEAIMAAFLADMTLGGAGYVDSIKGTMDTRTFGSVLCHCAELTISCRERV